MSLTPKQQRFVEEYLVDLDATKAARRAGYSARTANEQGSQLLSSTKVKAAVDAAIAARSRDTAITAAMVLQRFWAIATADVNELVEYRRTCCRHCHGAGHLYQRTRGELAAARRERDRLAAANPEVGPFDPQGGDGFDARKPPHPGCPECFGEGVGRAFFKDTRNLSPAARALYAGVKETRDGVQVLTHDQAAALANVARHLGMFKDRVEVAGKDGKPIEHDHAAGIAARIEQLAAAFAGVADRAGAGGAAGDGARKPLRPAGG